MLNKNKYLHFIFLFLFLVFEFFLTKLPLVNVLGFEFSFVHAILFSLVAVIYRTLRNEKLSHQVLFYSLLVLISLIFSFISTIICNQCPIDDGLQFYLVFVLPSFIIGISISDFALLISNRFRLPIAILIWIILTFSFLPELYFNPQIYFYNPIFVYYPGVIYDYTIELNKTIIQYRVLNIIFSVILILIVYRFNKIDYIKKSLVIGVIVAVIITFYKNKSYFGFATDLNKIERELPNTETTDHFNIYFPDSITMKQKRIITFEHEYYYSQLKSVLSTEPKEKITSIIFKDKQQKKKLFGAGNADVAKPWLNHIYLDLDNYDNSLKHEIAHVFSAQFSNTFLKLPSNFNPALIEGFAVALENNYGDMNIDYLTSIAYQNNYDVSISNLFTTLSFFSNTSSISYLYAGAFLKYLSKEYSWNHVKKLYGNGNFESIFDHNITFLESKFKNYLNTFSLPSTKNKADFYFGRRPLVKLKCARATAKQLKEANELFEHKKYNESKKMFEEIYNYSGHHNALIGLAKSNLMLGKAGKAIELISQKLSKFENTSYYYTFISFLADLNAVNGDTTNAIVNYKKILSANVHNYYNISSQFKINLLERDPVLLKKYLTKKSERERIILNDILRNPNDNNLQLLWFQDSIINKYDNYKKQISPLINNTKLNSDTYFQLAKIAYLNMDFNLAEEFISKSKINARKDKINIIKQLANRINSARMSL